MEFTPQQQQIIQAPFDDKIVLSGPAGAGKSSAAVERMRYLAGNGIPAQSILVLVPQRSLGLPYLHQINAPEFPAGGTPAVVTLGGLSQRLLSLFWPLVSKAGGFVDPYRAPQFLTLESAQYFMAQIVEPKFQKGYFENVNVDPNRLYSQILDNMNKAAVVGFPLGEFGDRLKSAWIGAASQHIVYDQAQECALQFRKFCLDNNLLDFSLQFECFIKILWPSYLCRQMLFKRYRHLIYDNIEEDVPTTHDLIREWLPHFDSALLIQDSEGGFRSFLGADPVSAQGLVSQMPKQSHFSGSFIQSTAMKNFETAFRTRFQDHRTVVDPSLTWKPAFEVQSFRFYPEMIEWTTSIIARLIQEKGYQPGEIAVLTPFLSDSLRFSLFESFRQRGIDVQTFRPSRSLKDEPAARAMLTFARLAYPEWNLAPTRHEVRQALQQTIEGLDLVRADLLVQTLYSPNNQPFSLASFDQIRPEMQMRITYLVGERYSGLRDWLINFQDKKSSEVDLFFSRFFGEQLSQKGYRFHHDYEAASVCSRLIESARKFRQSVLLENISTKNPPGKEYLLTLEQGLIAAQSLTGWDVQASSNAVLLAPAFTFLMSNRPVRSQFWLDIGSQGWWTRLDQPLTHPYILSRQWKPGTPWTEANDFSVDQANLLRLATGLLRRCRDKVYLEIAGMNEQGNEERSQLVILLQSLLRAIAREEEAGRV